jgi:hypothetical protein
MIMSNAPWDYRCEPDQDYKLTITKKPKEQRRREEHEEEEEEEEEESLVSPC